MRVTTWLPAGAASGMFDERFALGVWERMAGQQLPWMYEGQRVGTATVVSAVVADDGAGVALTLDLEDDGTTGS